MKQYVTMRDDMIQQSYHVNLKPFLKITHCQAFVHLFCQGFFSLAFLFTYYKFNFVT